MIGDDVREAVVQFLIESRYDTNFREEIESMKDELALTDPTALARLNVALSIMKFRVNLKTLLETNEKIID